MNSIIESWDGYKWQVRSDYAWDTLVLYRREFGVAEALLQLSGKDKTLADVGAHIGAYTVRMSKLYREVYAFEPNPETIQALKANLVLNGVSNVRVFETALGDSAGELELGLRQAGSTLTPLKVAHRVKVKVARMDDVLDRVDVVKVDVEGWEEQVLLGASRIIKDIKPAWIIEHHGLIGPEYEPYVQGMKERISKVLQGYASLAVSGCHWVYVPEDADLRRFTYGIVKYWFNLTVENIKKRRGWFYGLPLTWWYGMDHHDFISELPEHVRDEPEWLRGAQRT